MEEALKDSFLIMCPDGAVHPRLQQGDQNIITYSLTLCSNYLVKVCVMYPSSGRNILPYIQLRGKENTATIASVLKEMMNTWDNIKSDIPLLYDCYLYDLADGKALYIIQGHTHWASGTEPFLLCKCEWGQSINKINDCHMHTDQAYIDMMPKSFDQWAKRDEITRDREEWGNGSPYDLSAHKEWCTDKNKGVTHLGAIPLTYAISNVRFDVFHGRSAVVKVLLKYIRRKLDGIPAHVNKFAAFFEEIACMGWICD